MSRSSRKGPYVDIKLLRKIEVQKAAGGREPIKTWARACTVVPDFIGHTFLVHNGKGFGSKVFITDNMVGHKLGEFAMTRTFRGHGGVKKDGAAAGAAPAAAAPAAPAKA